MDYKEFYFNRKNLYLPKIRVGIQKEKKRVLISTKKIKTRWVNSVSDKNIELIVLSDKNTHPSNPNFEFYPINEKYGVQIDDYYLGRIKNAIQIPELFSTLGISHMSELFNDTTPNGYDVVIYTRDPITRLLSGYVQLLESEQFQSSGKSIIDNMSLDEAVETMNQHVEDITLYLNRDDDDHVGFWNLVIDSIISDKEKTPKIIDIDNNNDDPKLEGVSHKSIYTRWLQSNSYYVKRFFELTSLFLNIELNSYYNVKGR